MFCCLFHAHPLLLPPSQGKEELWTKGKGGKENSDSKKTTRLFALSEAMKELVPETGDKLFVLHGLACLQVRGTFISAFHSRCLVQILVTFSLIRMALEILYSFQ